MSVTISGTNGITSNSTVIPSNEVLVTLDDVQTLTNKTLGATAFTGNITSSGNPSLNIGTGALTAGSGSFVTTPSTWLSTHIPIEIGNGGALIGRTDGNGTFIATNLYRATDGNWKFKATGGASYIQLGQNVFIFGGTTGNLGDIYSQPIMATFSSTGLSVTGSLSATTDLLLQRSSGSSLMKVARFVGSTTNPLTSAATGDKLAIGNAGGTDLLFVTNDTTQATLDASGNLGLGVTPSAWGGTYKAIDLAGYGSAGGSASAAFVTSNMYHDGVDWVWKANAVASLYYQNSGGHYWYRANAGTGRIGASLVQLMTLDASGNLTVNGVNALFSLAIGGGNGLQVKDTGNTSGAYFMTFLNATSNQIGSITRVTTTNAVAFNTSSDERLKDDMGVVSSTDVIDATVVHDFAWKSNGEVDRGVFAQEAQKVNPRAVVVGSDEISESGDLVKPWGVDYSKYIPDLIVYCQQLKIKNDALEARLAALENK
jgi:hypothetical protein